MSTPSDETHLRPEIVNFYIDRVRNFGDSSEGVGWKDDQAQLVRFAQLTKLLRDKSNFSINDLGCGTGKLYKFLLTQGYSPETYNGYDILDEMLKEAERNLLPNASVNLSKIRFSADMTLADYTVASGIFNVKYGASEKEWLDHILLSIGGMNTRSRLGFAFNLLTKYSDKDYLQSYLYYADPLFLFDYCKKKFSKNVALLHDYNLFDFTIIVRKG